MPTTIDLDVPPLAGDIFRKCFDSFDEISPQYGKIGANTLASAGISWLGVANLVGCVDCGFKAIWWEDKGSTFTLQSYRHNADFVRCAWARLDAGWDSDRVRAAIKEYNDKERCNDSKLRVVIDRSDLRLLRDIQQEIEVVIHPLIEKYTGTLLGDQRHNSKTLGFWELGDLKRVDKRLSELTDRLTENSG